MIKFNGSLQPGEEIIIDLENYTATINGANALKYLADSDFKVFLNGNSAATYTGDAPITLTVTYKERWR